MYILLKIYKVTQYLNPHPEYYKDLELLLLIISLLGPSTPFLSFLTHKLDALGL